jgi:hypothetical protein
MQGWLTPGHGEDYFIIHFAHVVVRHRRCLALAVTVYMVAVGVSNNGWQSNTTMGLFGIPFFLTRLLLVLIIALS